MSKSDTITIKDSDIRKGWDEASKSWQYSIVDVIALVTESKDPRNYWKVLKSRLNKVNAELVTRCNQLKLPSSDGKSYLTDTASAETLIEIINIISMPAVAPFRIWFDKVESAPTTHSKSLEETDTDMGADLLVDAYETSSEIVIETMVAGVSSENLIITAICNSITIRGKRPIPPHVGANDMLAQELYWGIFSRLIPLPHEIDIDEVEATVERGLLKIRLQKRDKLRTRIIKVKSK